MEAGKANAHHVHSNIQRKAIKIIHIILESHIFLDSSKQQQGESFFLHFFIVPGNEYMQIRPRPNDHSTLVELKLCEQPKTKV